MCSTLFAMGITTEQRLDAMYAQLKAEITASRFHSIRGIADYLGYDYTTFYKWVTGKSSASLRMDVVYAVIGALGISPGEFFEAVETRAGRNSSSSSKN